MHVMGRSGGGGRGSGSGRGLLLLPSRHSVDDPAGMRKRHHAAADGGKAGRGVMRQVRRVTGDAEVGDEQTRRNDLGMRHVEEVR